MSKLCRALVLIEAVHYLAGSHSFLICETLLVEVLSMQSTDFESVVTGMSLLVTKQ